MLRNRDLKFHCEHVYVRVEQTDTPFTRRAAPGRSCGCRSRTAKGNYYAEPEVIAELEANRQVIFRYCDARGRASTDAANPNGSLERASPASATKRRNVVGLMPHPERACEPLLGSADGLVFFESVVQACRPRSCGSGGP